MQWGITEIVNASSFQTFAIVFCTSENLLVRDLWSSRNERNPLSWVKDDLRKCCGVSQKQWVLEFSNICYCVLHPWKITSRYFWSSRNKKKLLSKQKSCFEKMLWGISELVSARAFKPLPLCSMHPWNLTSRDFWSSRNERKPLSQLKDVLRKWCGVSQKQWMLELSNH